MFDIGLTEIIVIIIAACVFLDVKDVPKIIKWFNQVVEHCNAFMKEIKKLYHDINGSEKTILDDHGKKHLAYDLDDIMPDLIEDNEKKQKKD